MGYTHYWYRPKHLSAGKFRAASRDCGKVVGHLMKNKGFALAYEFGDSTRPPVFSDTEVRFNGVGDNGCETFVVLLDFQGGFHAKERGPQFDFCKTRREPYDAAVCACLIVLRHHFGGRFAVSSDGGDDEENWPVAREACREVLGYGGDFSLAMSRQSPFDRHGLRYSSGEPIGDDWTDYDFCDGGLNMRRATKRSFSFRCGDVILCDHNQSLASFRNLKAAQWHATYLFLSEELKDSIRATPNGEVGNFLVAFKNGPGDWTSLRILADWLEERGDKNARKLRAWLPKERGS